MKTSWKTTQRLEDYRLRRLTPEDALLVEAELLTNPELRETLQWQERTYELLQAYGRQQLRREILSVQHRLFYRPEYRSFRQIIRQLFTNF